MGSGKRKTIELQQEPTGVRRRTDGIIIDEGEVEREKENKELERKHNSSNNTEYRDKGKEKSENIPKSEYLQNLAQEGIYHWEKGSTSQTNGQSGNVMPEKHVLEFVIDGLQRIVPEELFVEPLIPMVQGCYRATRRQMDFGAIRAKVHNEVYANMEDFKDDLFQMCTHAMNSHPANTRAYHVAESIQGMAKRVLEDISISSLQRFYLETLVFSHKHPRTNGHARFRCKPADKNNGTGMTPETEMREKHLPPTNKPPYYKVLNASIPNFQVYPNSSVVNTQSRMSLRSCFPPLHPIISDSNPRALANANISFSINPLRSGNLVSGLPIQNKNYNWPYGLNNEHVKNQATQGHKGRNPIICCYTEEQARIGLETFMGNKFPQALQRKSNVNHTEEKEGGKEKGGGAENNEVGDDEELCLDLKL